MDGALNRTSILEELRNEGCPLTVSYLPNTLLTFRYFAANMTNNLFRHLTSPTLMLTTYPMYPAARKNQFSTRHMPARALARSGLPPSARRMVCLKRSLSPRDLDTLAVCLLQSSNSTASLSQTHQHLRRTRSLRLRRSIVPTYRPSTPALVNPMSLA